ncbi:MAG: LacI family DNA-binding transcriptional regulator [Spirochaetaceae bacterium]|nr:LacI family DNA-binding transcriptional regulator [Spirochaetaceae bacterium]
MEISDNKNKKTVTQDDVARRAGVSRSIVSYVLNPGSRPVALETRKKVLQAIEDLGYRPNKFAQNLMKSANDTVADKQFGLILSDVFMLRRPYYADILAGIHTTAHENNHHIRFMRFFHDLKDPILFNELIHKEEISGLILFSLDQSIKSDEDKKLIEQIRARINNIICIEWELEGVSSVNFSRREAAYKACNHLISKGKKNILYIGPLDNRIPGYQQAILKNLGSENLLEPCFGSNLSDGYNICQSLIAEKKLPEAILGGTDEVSMGILRSLHQNNIKVPQDISIVSIDNIEMASFTNPPLTTVNVETWQMGSVAVQTLIQRVKNRDSMITQTLLPIQLIIRESC